MPHTSKKYRKQQGSTPKGPNRTILFAVIGVIAVIAIAGGYFVLSSAQHTTTTTSTATNSTNSTASLSVTPANGLIYAKFDTTQGTFVAELYQNETPKTVANFVSLANSGFYNNLVWHRIVKGFVIQTGDPTSRNGGGSPCTWGQTSAPNTNIPFEDVPSLHNVAGSLGMASTGAGQPGQSQFYVNLADNSASLDGSYAVFGQVISGMNVVDAIGNLPISSACGSSGSPPATPSQAMLISVTISSTPPSS